MVDGLNQALDNLDVQYTYHVHEGSAGTTANGCYTKATYHVHTGSSSSGGGCYTKSTSSTTCGRSLYKYQPDAYTSPSTWNVACSSCGEGYTSGTASYCEQYIASKPKCTKTISTSTVTLTCGMTTSTITGYVLGCGKTTDTIESATIIY